MARLHASGYSAHAELRTRTRARQRRLRWIALAAVAGSVLVPILVLALDSASTSRPIAVPPADRLLPAGPPSRQVIAFQGTLRLYLPIAESRVTAIGYHAVGGGALALDPVGSQANAGLFTRLLNRLFGEGEGGVRYNLMGGGPGPETAGLDVGAPAGTDVFAPVDGTVVAVSDRVLSGAVHGAMIDLQPSGSPGLIVRVTNIDPDEALTVGSSVVAVRTRLGSVLDLSEVEQAALAEYTQDRGQHVHIEVRPTADLSLP